MKPMMVIAGLGLVGVGIYWWMNQSAEAKAPILQYSQPIGPTPDSWQQVTHALQSVSREIAPILAAAKTTPAALITNTPVTVETRGAGVLTLQTDDGDPTWG